jgi:simple sugar transport system substrate-binding protein
MFNGKMVHGIAASAATGALEQSHALKGTRIHALFADNDDMAIGAIEAMEKVGLRPGKDVVIVSVDAARIAFKATIAGKLN